MVHDKSQFQANNFTFCWFNTGKNALKWLECCMFRVWGMLNPMAWVLILCDEWCIEKSQFQAKISHFVRFWLGKKHQNGLSGTYLKFESVTNNQWHRFQRSHTISGSWLNQQYEKSTGKNFTFCWFWLGKMHWNGLSGAYGGFKACQI